MAAFAAGIFNHAMTATQTLTNTNSPSGPVPLASGEDGTSSTSASTASITANDFLTLLVTEMKNQDPTANNDPNQYINQLVNVNSLEQLIDINQNLSAALAKPTADAGAISAGQTLAATPAHTNSTAPNRSRALAAQSGPPAFSNPADLTTAVKYAKGNLTVPEAAPAALRVASALGGRPHTPSIAGTAH